ncbi:hypothetical protein GCM10010218_53100 [Streptomyces mashuensis]|uniref:DUF4185 domain-containing protein n=1 Tax=Streptomyces mashuensis TaxID=33904 RepID=A0A919B772_9ACTN|nr:hypothetical protein [Streptomyces mashuensis]GHF65024.1 hypothetical protein GCM10010218_53100 [Streptomyces mashuensis]
MRVLRLLVPAVLCALVPSAAAPAGGPPGVVSVRPLTALDRAFAAYAERTPAPDHWTGGDSTYSVRTPAGELWIFSDTFLGTIRPDGSRSPVTGDGGTTPFLHNSFVLWGPAGPRTVTGRDRAGRPASVVPEPDAGSWYWARAGVMEGREAAVVYVRYARTGPGPLDVAARGSVLARFAPGRGRPRSLTPLPAVPRVAWGAWLERQGRYTYVYGTEPDGSGGHHVRLARVAGPGLRGPWAYWTADGRWSADPARAARLAGPGGAPLRTSDELSVVRHGAWYALVTQRADRPFSAEVCLAWSRGPGGPFTRPRPVWTAPEAGPYGTYRDADVIAYNPHEHPELERPGELVVSYNVNSLDPAGVLRRAAIYRPRFVRVVLRPPAR